MPFNEYDPNYHRLASFLGISPYKRQDPTVNQKLILLHGWATKEAKSNDIVQITEKIHQLINDLGVQSRGKTLVDSLYRRIRIKYGREEQERQALEEREEALKRREARLESVREAKKAQRERIKSRDEKYKENRRLEKLAERRAKEAIKKHVEGIPQQKPQRIKDVTPPPEHYQPQEVKI
jgi:hypothetical protein